MFNGEEQANHLLRVVALKFVRDLFVGREIVENGVPRRIKDVYLPDEGHGLLYELEDA